MCRIINVEGCNLDKIFVCSILNLGDSTIVDFVYVEGFKFGSLYFY